METAAPPFAPRANRTRARARERDLERETERASSSFPVVSRRVSSLVARLVVANHHSIEFITRSNSFARHHARAL